jgi:S-formylglutathione hydrolase FrmB
MFRKNRELGRAQTVNKAAWLGLVLLVGWPVHGAHASGPLELALVNIRLHGQILDFTKNSCQDKRIWSRSLQEHRDLYVYVPPCFDWNQRYPLVILMHGFGADERMLFKVAPMIDEAIFSGKLPPLIIAAPDGSFTGDPKLCFPGSMFLNSQAGDFEDFICQDIWDFMVQHFPICPERQAHVLAGYDMGGFAAYSIAMRHRDGFGVVIGMMPLLNLRWTDKDGRYMSKFDPYDWGWREKLNAHELLGRFYLGMGNVRVANVVGPLWGSNDEEVMEEIPPVNPIELIDRTCLRDGELAMYVAYAGKDEYNIDAQVESFLYLAKYRGLSVGVGYAPNGKHEIGTALQLVPGIIKWLGPVLAPYSPKLCCPGVAPACATCPSGACTTAPCPTCASHPTQLPDLVPTSAQK